MYVHVYIYIFIFCVFACSSIIYIYICVHMYVHTHTSTYIYVYIYICILFYGYITSTYLYTYTCTHMHIYTHMHIHVHIHMQVRVQVLEEMLVANRSEKGVYCRINRMPLRGRHCNFVLASSAFRRLSVLQQTKPGIRMLLYTNDLEVQQPGRTHVHQESPEHFPRTVQVTSTCYHPQSRMPYLPAAQAVQFLDRRGSTHNSGRGQAYA